AASPLIALTFCRRPGAACRPPRGRHTAAPGRGAALSQSPASISAVPGLFGGRGLTSIAKWDTIVPVRRVCLYVVPAASAVHRTLGLIDRSACDWCHFVCCHLFELL